MDTKETTTAAVVDLSGLRSALTSTMHIRHPTTGQPLGWAWTIAGPGHDASIKLQDEIARERLHEEQAKEQARVNGKKWKAPALDAAEQRLKIVKRLSARVLGFPDAKVNGELITYSPEAVIRLLNDPGWGWLFSQYVDYVAEDSSFITSSAQA